MFSCLGRLGCLGFIAVLVLGAVLLYGLSNKDSDPVTNNDSGNQTGQGTNREPTATRRAQPTATRGVEPAAYEVVLTDDVSTGTRERYNVNIVMDPSESDAALAAGLAEAVRQGFRDNGGADVITVFAYSDASLVNTGADVGRAFATNDGFGTGGEGIAENGLLGPDEEGVIQIETRSLSSDAEQTTAPLEEND